MKKILLAGGLIGLMVSGAGAENAKESKPKVVLTHTVEVTEMLPEKVTMVEGDVPTKVEIVEIKSIKVDQDKYILDYSGEKRRTFAKFGLSVYEKPDLDMKAEVNGVDFDSFSTISDNIGIYVAYGVRNYIGSEPKRQYFDIGLDLNFHNFDGKYTILGDLYRYDGYVFSMYIDAIYGYYVVPNLSAKVGAGFGAANWNLDLNSSVSGFSVRAIFGLEYDLTDSFSITIDQTFTAMPKYDEIISVNGNRAEVEARLFAPEFRLGARVLF